MSADFSMQAAGMSKTGNVMFIRDPEGRKRWHAQSEELKEQTDGPPLYITGMGDTIEAAFDAARSKMQTALPIP